jgi:hypothetical protein
MRPVLLLLSLLSLCLSVHAGLPNDGVQDTDPKRWKAGFIVTRAGDTITGKVKINDFLDVFYDFQRKVAFKDQQGTVTDYYPYDLHSFSYYGDQDSLSRLVTQQSVSSPEGDGLVFLKLYCTGECKVYGYMITGAPEANMSPGGSMMRSSLMPSEKKYIQIGGHEFFPLRRIGFKKNMQEFFSQCPLIIARLESKIYTHDNWPALIRDYNCGVCK